MPYYNAGKHVMLNALGAVVTHLAAHTGFPATALNEVTGGSPVYARQVAAWATAGATVQGSMSLSNTPAFNIPAGTTVASIGGWSALTAGTLYADADVVDEVYANQGTYTITAGALNLNA